MMEHAINTKVFEEAAARELETEKVLADSQTDITTDPREVRTYLF